jgi:thioredoxin-like negative regulator of GroEL
MSDKIVHITDETFEEDVLKSGDPVLVDYWADRVRRLPPSSGKLPKSTRVS